MRRALVVILSGSFFTLSAIGCANAASREAREIAAARADGCFQANTKRRSLGAWIEVRAEVRCKSGAYGHWVVNVPKAASSAQGKNVQGKKKPHVAQHRRKDAKAEQISLKCTATPTRATKAKNTIFLKCRPAEADSSPSPKPHRHRT